MPSVMLKISLVFAVIQCYAKAETIEVLKQQYAELIVECAKDHLILPADVIKLNNKEVPESESAKCLLACAFKRTGMMNDKGEMSVEGIHEISQKYYNDNPELMMKADQFTEACKSVNDVVVTDGNKGCERAALLYKCSIEKAPQFDFVI